MKSIAFIIGVLSASWASAELLLLEKSGSVWKIVDFERAATDERIKLTDIYKNILSRYQFPMLSMYYAHENDSNKQIIGQILKKSSAQDIPEAELVNHFLAKKYGDAYRVFYVPSTLFEAVAIMTILRGLDTDPVPAQGAEDKRLTSYFSEKFSFDLASSFGDFYRREKVTTDNQEQRLGRFLQTTFAPYNLRDDVIKLYFKVAHELGGVLNVANRQQNNFTDALNKVFAQFTAQKSKFEHIVETKNMMMTAGFGGDVKKFIDNIFKEQSGQELLRKFLSLELDAAKKGHFMLTRGTRGLSITNNQRVLDLPYLETLRDFNDIVQNNMSLASKIEKMLGVIKPDQLQDNSSLGSYEPSSLSFATSLLAGTMAESAIAGGARGLDFMSDDHQMGYALPLGIMEYLTNKNISDAFFVSPLNTLVGLLSKGEFFHSRSKVGMFKIDKNWNSRIKGFQPSQQAPNLMFLADATLDIGAFTAPQVEWAMLAGFIANVIGERAIILIKGSKIKDSDDTLKNNQRVAASFIGQIDNLKQGKLASKNSSPLPSVIDSLFKSLIESKSLSLLAPKDARFYDPNNAFYPITKDPARNHTTELIINNDQAVVIADRLPRVKTHLLAIPKGEYISLPHWASHASSSEVEALFRTIAQAAEVKGLDKTGYRIITNHGQKPGAKENNHANQEVAHLHVHIAGGECLGKPVVGQKDSGLAHKLFNIKKNNDDMIELKRMMRNLTSYSVNTYPGYSLYQEADFNPVKNKIDSITPVDDKLFSPEVTYMGIDRSFMPWGIGLNAPAFIALIKRNQILSQPLTDGSAVIVYRVEPQARENVPVYLGATIINAQGQPRYNSVHDFMKYAPREHLEAVVKVLVSMASALGIDKTGYRLIANHGPDGWQIPRQVMQIFIAGGAPLGITVSNIFGNKEPGERENPEKDYKDFAHLPHGYCPVDPALSLQHAEDINALLIVNKENLATLSRADKEYYELQKNLVDFIKVTKELAADTKVAEPLRRKIVANRNHVEQKFSAKAQGIGDALDNLYHKLTNTPPQTLNEANAMREQIFAETSMSDMASYLEYENGIKHTASSLRYSLTGDWLFIDLDKTLTKDVDSTELIEPTSLKDIKALQKKGSHVLALTNRHYWPAMGEDGIAGYKNTFTLLRHIDPDFSFSNPGNLTEAPLKNPGSEPKTPGKNIPYFKDGVIFCADIIDKGQCLYHYLYRLADETDQTLPNMIRFIDDVERNVDAVVRILSKSLRIPSMGIYFKP